MLSTSCAATSHSPSGELCRPPHQLAGPWATAQTPAACTRCTLLGCRMCQRVGNSAHVYTVPSLLPAALPEPACHATRALLFPPAPPPAHPAATTCASPLSCCPSTCMSTSRPTTSRWGRALQSKNCCPHASPGTGGTPPAPPTPPTPNHPNTHTHTYTHHRVVERRAAACR